MASKSVFGIYTSRPVAETGINRLRAVGFRASDISVLAPESGDGKQIGVEEATQASEGVTSGGATGTTIGGSGLGWPAGINSLAIPGIGPLIAAGPIVEALAGLGAGALVRALAGYGIPEYEAKRYEDRIHDGGILVSVHSDDLDWASKARTVLEETDAEDVSLSSEVSADRAAVETAVAS